MKFTKNTVKGFTLIELLVVIAIIGLLSTIITGPIQNGLKKGRDAKKIGDMMALKNALAQYAVDNNGTFPTSISGLTAGGYLSSVPASADPATALKDKILYAPYTISGSITSYHMGVALEAQNPVLASDTDCQTAATCVSGAATTIAIPNLGTTLGATSGTALTGTSQDFVGGAVATEHTGACTLTAGVATCIYDIIP